jgi:hypothetical protein
MGTNDKLFNWLKALTLSGADLSKSAMACVLLKNAVDV